MLHHLDGGKPADAAIGLPFEVRERVALLDVELLRPAQVDHGRVRVDAARLHAAGAERREQFAAAAADVDDVAGRAPEPGR